MQINPIQLETHQLLLKDYFNENEHIISRFQYNPFQDSAYQRRIVDLQNNSYNRKGLSETLSQLNEKWAAPDASMENIEKLKQNDSVAVLAGQQAGVLTGPLYTINKILSLLQFARDQEEKLGVSVIPVFWIAGEDHDFAEINHVFMPIEENMKKVSIGQHAPDKAPVSNVRIDHEKLQSWINDLFASMLETEHTKSLYEKISLCLRSSETFVDFFARVIYQLFPDTGLVLVDSGAEEIRKLESDCFVQLINHQPDIAKGVHQSVQTLKQQGYALSLETTQQDGHLFYHVNNMRVLLTRDEETAYWVSKQGDIQLTTEELLHIARQTPEKLSNNVVTRPVMQEWLFPTLAFIGGPGEVSYWAGLKPAFEACGLKMPPVIPRQSYTYVDRDVERALEKHHISVKQAIASGVSKAKGNWLAAQNNPPIAEMVHEIKRTLNNAHHPLQEASENILPDLGDIARNNLQHLHHELDDLEKRITKSIKGKFVREIAEFNLIDLALKPDHNLQERVWTPLPFMNLYGLDFAQKLASRPWHMKQSHYVVYL